jgi:hypothetical protein
MIFIFLLSLQNKMTLNIKNINDSMNSIKIIIPFLLIF